MEQENRYFLTGRELDLIVKTLNPAIRKFSRGELLLKNGMKENRIFIFLGGTAYLEVENEYDSKQILDYFVRGQILCHDMLIQPNNGNCYVVAKYPCTVALADPLEIEKYRQVGRDKFFDRLPDFIFQTSLSMVQQHCHILQQKTIRNKLLTFLHCQAQRQHTYSVRLPVPYSDLADYLGVDRSALMKELGRMACEGLITKQSHQITLSDGGQLPDW